MRLLAALIWLLVVLAACAPKRTYVVSQVDYDELLAAAIKTVEGRGPPLKVIVLSASLPPEARKAADRLREVIDESDLKPANGYDLPSGYFVLKSFSVSSHSSRITGLKGPIKSHPLDCGTRYDIPFIQEDQKWHPADYTVMVC